MDIIFFFTSKRWRLYLVTELFFSDTWTWNFSMFQSLVLCVYEMLVALKLCQCHFQELMLDKSRFFFFFEISRVKEVLQSSGKSKSRSQRCLFWRAKKHWFWKLSLNNKRKRCWYPTVAVNYHDLREWFRLLLLLQNCARFLRIVI